MKHGEITTKNLTDCFDAKVWTDEWLKTIKDKPHIPTDEGTMLSWFANAIMAGHDHAYQKIKVKADKFLKPWAEEKKALYLRLIRAIENCETGEERREVARMYVMLIRQIKHQENMIKFIIE